MTEKNERWPKIMRALLRRPLVKMEAKTRQDGKFLVVMPYSYPRIYFLNEPAAAYYACYDRARTGQELADTAAKAFPDVPRSTIEHDLAVFLLSMLRCRVLGHKQRT